MVYTFRLAVCVLLLLATTGADRASAQDLKKDKSWEKVVSEKKSVVLGRFEGQFLGSEFKDIRIRVLDIYNDRTYFLDVVEGLGFIEELLPPGRYALSGVEATYFPEGAAMNPRVRPVKQSFVVNPQHGEAIPTFDVPADRPVYIGTIQSGVDSEGLVHRGHRWRVLDEYEYTIARLREFYPKFAASLARLDIEPARNFVLKPIRPEPVLEFVGVGDPVNKSREYIDEGKYESAINWLATFLPASDAERLETELLIGEALLGQRKYDEAIERLGDVLQADPERMRALRLLARAHALNGDLEDAQVLFEALAEIDQHDAEANLHLGYLYALGSDSVRSAAAFSSAFLNDTDYLLHDVVPFVVALRAVQSGSARFEPPAAKGELEGQQPRIRSRRDVEDGGGFSILIDHEGKFVAAQVSSSSGSSTATVLAMVRTNFRPAALNGVPVPAVIAMGGPGNQ